MRLNEELGRIFRPRADFGATSNVRSTGGRNYIPNKVQAEKASVVAAAEEMDDSSAATVVKNKGKGKASTASAASASRCTLVAGRLRPHAARSASGEISH